MNPDSPNSKKTFSIKIAFSVIQVVLSIITLLLLFSYLMPAGTLEWLVAAIPVVLVAVLLSILIVPRIFLRSFLAVQKRLENRYIETAPFTDTPVKELNQIGHAVEDLIVCLQETSSALEKEIEAHKESKAELAWSETLYRSVVEDSPGFLCIFLPSGEITFVNKSYAKYYETEIEEIIGKSFLDFLHEDDRKRVLKEIHTLNKEHPSNAILQRVYLPSGEVHHQRWVNHALFSENGEIIGYQAFGEDIEQEHKVQQAQNALYRIWQAANKVSTLDEFYPALHEIIQEIIPTKNFSIGLFDEKNQRLALSYYADEKDPRPEQTHSYRGPAAYVFKNNISLRCTPEEFLATVPEIPMQAIVGTPPRIWLGVPLLLNNKTIGVMAMQDYESKNAIGPADQEFLEMLSPSIAATIARRHAEEELRSYAQTNEVLFKASRTINEALNLEQLYRSLHDFIQEVVECDFFIVSAYDAETQMISCECLIQNNQVRNASDIPTIPLNTSGEGIQSRAILQKESRLISDYLKEIEKTQASYYVDSDGNIHSSEEADLTAPITRSALVFPLLFGGEVSGVVQVMSYNENAYTDKDLHIFETIANQIAVARNNVRLYQQAQAELELRKEAEKELQSLNAQLEERVKERTKELDERVATVETLNTGMANILHDLNIANKQAEKNARELGDTNAELEAFSYSVSHDLRAPLRHIESFAQLLQQETEDRLDQSEKRYFSNIFAATAKMQNLIQDMLMLSRASRVEFNLKQVDMNQVVESVREELFDEVEGRNIEWKLDHLPTVQADAGLIKIVWTNLIENAIKYTRPRETAVIEISTHASEKTDHDSQVFYVRDNGVGFDETYSDNLFGVFQRLHHTDEFEGSGVGLATVRRIIARHGGRVWAEGTLQKGATFYFSLPIHIRQA